MSGGSSFVTNLGIPFKFTSVKVDTLPTVRVKQKVTTPHQRLYDVDSRNESSFFSEIMFR